MPRTSNRFFWAAAVAGSLHAGWSAYWLMGGSLLLESVGQWAATTGDSRGSEITAMLAATMLLKLGAAWVPLLAENRILAGRKAWRTTSWIGAACITVYGLANIAASGAALLNVLPTAPDSRSAHLGHALLWGPLFVLWGIALLIALARSKQDQARGLTW